MKKYAPFLIIIVLICVIFAIHGPSGSKNSASSYIKVLHKEFSKKGGYWVEAINPYDTKSQPFNIKIDSINTWNLLLENEIYLASYEFTSSNYKEARIQSIRYPAKPEN